MPFTAQGYRARDLRNAMTKAEVILWSQLKRLRSEGFHIRRQVPFRGYYLDFAWFSRRLVIEVDGESHEEPAQARHDEVRDAVLRREGFQVVRISNAEVRENLDGVMYLLRAKLAEAEVSPPGPRQRREPPSP